MNREASTSWSRPRGSGPTWASGGRTATGRRSFHIHGVTGPDEYTTVVNDNLFTNVMARFNLAKAAELLRQLQREFPRAYQRVVERLELGAEEIDEWGRLRSVDVDPVRRGHRDQPTGRPLP